jgi:hypothetical protein
MMVRGTGEVLQLGVREVFECFELPQPTSVSLYGCL